jgi:hypothetical protein
VLPSAADAYSVISQMPVRIVVAVRSPIAVVNWAMSLFSSIPDDV